uniref:Transcription factor A, mitochondrial n=1 Tax=Nothoprocta perdicaria TaxID=30464 RepID=A0A8C6ZL04_NOTPE
IAALAAERGLCRRLGTRARPKRPLNAYLRFLRESQPLYRQKHPEMSILELVKKMAGAWRELPPSEKQVYEKAGQADWQKYHEELAEYKAQLTPADAAALREEKERQLARRRFFQKKRELTVLGKPKKSRNAFNIFVSENYPESQGASPTAKMKNLYDKWQQLTSSQKQTYLQLSEDDKVRYENEMKSWEAKMVELGREDLLRATTRKAKEKTPKTVKSKAAKTPSQEAKAKLKLKESEE